MTWQQYAKIWKQKHGVNGHLDRHQAAAYIAAVVTFNRADPLKKLRMVGRLGESPIDNRRDEKT